MEGCTDRDTRSGLGTGAFARTRQLQALVGRRRTAPLHWACRVHETADPLRPRWGMGSSHVNHVEQNLKLSRERDAQADRVPFAPSLPDVASDGLDSGRFVLGPKAARRAVQSELEDSLLRLRRDLGAARLANGEGRAVDRLAVEMDLQNEGVAAHTAPEPVPDDFVPRGTLRLARDGHGHQC